MGYLSSRISFTRAIVVSSISRKHKCILGSVLFCQKNISMLTIKTNNIYGYRIAILFNFFNGYLLAKIFVSSVRFSGSNFYVNFCHQLHKLYYAWKVWSDVALYATFTFEYWPRICMTTSSFHLMFHGVFNFNNVYSNDLKCLFPEYSGMRGYYPGTYWSVRCDVRSAGIVMMSITMKATWYLGLETFEEPKEFAQIRGIGVSTSWHTAPHTEKQAEKKCQGMDK